MASIHKTKKEIKYLVNEVISNGYLALYFQSEDNKDALLDIITKAVDLYNDLIDRVNHPIEKHNPKLVKKHYVHLRKDMLAKVDGLFEEISTVCSK